MARSDLLIKLVRAGNTGDQNLFKKTVDAVIAEERAKHHHILANRLADQMQTNGSSNKVTNISDSQIGNLLFEIVPQRNLQDIFLPKIAEDVSKELIEEHRRADLLRSYNLEPRSRILLTGPPGNGKTSFAECLATELMVPLMVVRYEGVIGTYLGETATRLKRLFDYVSTRHCVLFFDEFDTIGKERGDIHETGEIKRVVSSLLLQIDALPSYVVVVTATNHPELLDRAVWRRFQARLSLPHPKQSQMIKWFKRFEDQLGKSLGYAHKTLAEKLKGSSFAELEDFCATIQRRYVLTLPNSNMKSIVSNCLKQWQARMSVSNGKKRK